MATPPSDFQPLTLDALFAGAAATMRTSCAQCGRSIEGSAEAGRAWFRDHDCRPAPGEPDDLEA